MDRSRFTGACYRAANWRLVGQTTSQTRNDKVTRNGAERMLKDVEELFRQFKSAPDRPRCSCRIFFLSPFASYWFPMS